MHKIDKFLLKLNKKERKLILTIIAKLEINKLDNLDVKKLKGFEDIFRARKGNFRIVFQRQPNEIVLIKIERKKDDTYKF